MKLGTTALLLATAAVTSACTPPDPPSEEGSIVGVLLDTEEIWLGYGTTQFGARDLRRIENSTAGYDWDALAAVLAHYGSWRTSPSSMTSTCRPVGRCRSRT